MVSRAHSPALTVIVDDSELLRYRRILNISAPVVVDDVEVHRHVDGIASRDLDVCLATFEAAELAAVRLDEGAILLLEGGVALVLHGAAAHA